jgi:hypothetical protein
MLRRCCPTTDSCCRTALARRPATKVTKRSRRPCIRRRNDRRSHCSRDRRRIPRNDLRPRCRTPRTSTTVPAAHQAINRPPSAHRRSAASPYRHQTSGPATGWSRTTGGSRHRYYRWPESATVRAFRLPGCRGTSAVTTRRSRPAVVTVKAGAIGVVEVAMCRRRQIEICQAVVDEVNAIWSMPQHIVAQL